MEPKDSCFTIYPDVLVRSVPSQKGKIVRKIVESSLIHIEENDTSEISKIEIRSKLIEGNWLKISDGWIFSGLVKCIPRVVFSSPFLYHGGELPFDPNDQKDWIAIYNRNIFYSRELIQINVKRAYDAIIDENENVKTGYQVSAKGTPIVLVKGIPFKDGNFAVNKKSIPSSIELGKQYKFSFGKDNYVLKSSGLRVDSDKIRNYKLVLRKNDDEMIIDTQEERFEIPTLILVGDIDGDGELDFIFDLKNHYNVSEQHLYLSSEKENDFFVVPVSVHETTGC
ncbi:SH3 domain-containing protein [Leptospira venezuelensis]|uniref:SH3 domain-containing protein n=1 Tax=Leptospira venezuelensis TaxID=1958811 RepID=UPI001F40C79E|nr:SH3 domain-containing protein [Leptospira venezuelensis]